MNEITITLIGVLFVFLMTTLGSAVVFLFRKPISEKINSLFLGFASGLMIAASVWSLILPSIEQSSYLGSFCFVPSAFGIVFGCLFLIVMDKLIPKMLNSRDRNNKFNKNLIKISKNSLKNDKKVLKFNFSNNLKYFSKNRVKKYSLSKSSKLFLAVTLHNIPEGLAVGLAFGNAFSIGSMSAFYSALWLAIGIGLQNLPEGTAVTLPLKDGLGSNKKAFLFGSLSGVVEPIMALIGIWLSTSLSHLMPWFLAFSAGAMLFVVAEELLPDAKNNTSGSIGSIGFIVGFIIMMILDVALG